MRTLLSGLSAWLVGLTFASAQTAADLNEGLKVEENTSVSGAFTVSWWGKDGWTYFIQQSEDLIHWQYVPEIVSGENAAVSWGISTNAPRLFFKLRLTDIATDDPHDADFDGDGLSNAEELELGLDPFKTSSSGDGTLDGNLDGDVDGLTNTQEKTAGCRLTWKDHPAVELEAYGF